MTQPGFPSPITFVPDCHWAQWPAGQKILEVPGIATDSHDRVYLFNRGDRPLSIFDSDGKFLRAWEGVKFVRPHGITIGPDDTVFCVDDMDHTVSKFSPDGELLMRLGTSGKPSNTGATSLDYRTIRQAGPPFHYPTNLAIAPNGDLYISDGYGNARIHHFSAEGKLLHSWGKPGTGPSEFHVPHGIAVDARGTVFVADRENSRLQLFTAAGDYLTEWKDVVRPCEVVISRDDLVFVAELGYRAGMWPGTEAPYPNAPGGRVSIFDADGNLVQRWGGGEHPTQAGDFYAPHDLWLDSRGDLYVAEVVYAASGKREMSETGYHTLQKFRRRGQVSR